MNHETYMRRAIEIASANPKAPFGAVLVDTEQDRLICEGLNNSSRNPTLHGEMDALNRYADTGANRWGKLRMYTTAEPCCMCQAAIMWAGIPEVVFGTSIKTLVKFGWNQFDLTAEDVVRATPFAECNVLGGVLAAECDSLFETAKHKRSPK